MFKAVYTINDKKKNNNLVSVIKSGLSDSKNEIKNMAEEEKEIEKPTEIIDVVEKSSWVYQTKATRTMIKNFNTRSDA